MAKTAAPQRNKDYWHDRFGKLENRHHKDAQTYIKDLEEQFRVAQNNLQMDIEHWYMRLAANNDISYLAAKKMLKQNELEEFHWTVSQYIQKGRENAVNQLWMKELENASAKVHISRLEAMKLSIQQHAELLYTRYEGGFADFLSKTYQNNYYHTAYEVAKGTGVGVNLHTIDQRKIDTVLVKSWAADGADFSSRIWTNKNKMVNELHAELSQCLIRGDVPDKAIKHIAKTMGTSRHNAGRLVMTESAAVASTAQKDAFRELGVERYEIVATLDSHTSEICQNLDGKVCDMKDYEVGVTAPPFHCWCRTVTVPYFEDNGGMRAARDGEGQTYYVPADMEYSEWKEKYVDGSVKEELKQPRIDRYEGSALKNAGITNVAVEDMDIDVSGEVKRNILSNCNEVAFMGKKEGVEYATMLDVNTGESVNGFYLKKGEQGRVSVQEFVDYVNDNKDGKFAFIHNHTNGTMFSLDDIELFVQNNIQTMYLVSDSHVIFLDKKSNTIYNKTEIIDNYNNYLKEKGKDKIIEAFDNNKTYELLEQFFIDNKFGIKRW